MSESPIIIELNVGGKLFTTTKKTLGPLKKLPIILGRWNDDDSNNTPLFIDRDPGKFQEILELLRDPQLPIPENLSSELKYYGFESEKDNGSCHKSEAKNSRVLNNNCGTQIIRFANDKGETDDANLDYGLPCFYELHEDKDSLLSFHIPREVHKIKNIYLQCKLDRAYPSAATYKLINRVELQSNKMILCEVWGGLLELLDVLDENRTGWLSAQTFMCKLPFAELDSIFANAHSSDLTVNVKLNNDLDIKSVDCKVIIHALQYSKEWSKSLNKIPRHVKPLYQWQRGATKYIRTDETIKEIPLNLSGKCTQFIFCAKDKFQNFVPITRIRLISGNNLIFDLSHEILMQHMRSTNKIKSLNSSKFVYIFDVNEDGGYIYMSALADTSIEVHLPQEHDPCIFTLFAQSRNEIACCGGLIGIGMVN